MTRTSPVYDCLAQRFPVPGEPLNGSTPGHGNGANGSRNGAVAEPTAATWRTLADMPTLWNTPTDAHREILGIADLSFLPRFGVKGAIAADWLAQQGLPIPPQPNSWLALPQGGIIARLGLTEFLVEDGFGDDPNFANGIVARLHLANQSPPSKVYPVLRQDLAIALCGAALPDLLQQTCNVNFQALNLGDRPVILTSMIGVSVVVIPGDRQGIPFYRLWCDNTFGTYLWTTLLAIAQELGGDLIGAGALPPPANPPEPTHFP